MSIVKTALLNVLTKIVDGAPTDLSAALADAFEAVEDRGESNADLYKAVYDALREASTIVPSARLSR